MNKNKFIAATFLSGISCLAQSIDVGSLTLELQENESFVVKNLNNKEKVGKLVTTKVIEVDNPKSLTPISDTTPTVLVSPATLLIGAEGESNVKVFYNGPEDDKERYYKLIFVEQTMSVPGLAEEFISAQAKQIISIATVLVVRPRKLDWAYKMDGKGEITNTGNSFIHTVAMGKCEEEGKDEPVACTKEGFVLPGESIDFSKKMQAVDGIGLWRGMKYEFINNTPA